MRRIFNAVLAPWHQQVVRCFRSVPVRKTASSKWEAKLHLWAKPDESPPAIRAKEDGPSFSWSTRQASNGTTAANRDAKYLSCISVSGKDVTVSGLCTIHIDLRPASTKTLANMQAAEPGSAFIGLFRQRRFRSSELLPEEKWLQYAATVTATFLFIDDLFEVFPSTFISIHLSLTYVRYSMTTCKQQLSFSKL